MKKGQLKESKQIDNCYLLDVRLMESQVATNDFIKLSSPLPLFAPKPIKLYIYTIICSFKTALKYSKQCK